jgi:hypothetical protein
MKRITFLIIFAAVFSFGTTAQSLGTSYKTALGVKVFDGAGITLKSFVTNNNALEFIGFFNRHSSRITGLYEIHGNISGAPGLRWYVGPGAHISFYGNNNRNRFDNYAAAGLDGVLGLDLKINKAPLNFSIDWQPSFEFGEYRAFLGNQGGLAIRYTF